MKKLTVICLGLIAGGCATTDQLAESNARIEAFEKRLVRIETDLYEPVKNKKVLTNDYPKYQLKNTEPIKRILDETNVIDGICGYKFGDVACGVLTGGNEQSQELKQSFRLFKRASLRYTQIYKRLHRVFLCGWIEGVTAETVEEEFIKTKDVVERKFGIDMGSINRRPQYKEFKCSYVGRGVKMRLWTNSQSKNGAGFWFEVECPRIVEEDKKRADKEAKKISIPEGEGADVL